jgi:[ribosomal protein S5]-alanine N-acetyltransferase
MAAASESNVPDREMPGFADLSRDKPGNLLTNDFNIDVREITVADHEMIIDYFLNADKDFLYGMGVDIAKLPSKQEWLNILNSDFYVAARQKQFFYIIWLLNGQPIGHSNINKIIFAEEAYMHLHLWSRDKRQKGLGAEFLKRSIPYFFNTFQLKKLYCEPSAANAAPNKALQKAGFDLIRSYETTPGWINFFQTVNRWCLSKEKYEVLFNTQEKAI